MKAPLILLLGILVPHTSAQVAPTETNLRAAATSGGVTKFSGNGTISLTSPVIINADTTLDADGHAVSIDGGNVTRLFEVTSSGKLTLKGLHLINGRSNGTNSPINGGGPAGAASGGAIQNLGGQVIAISCIFLNNNAIGGSGQVTGPFVPTFVWNNGGAASGGAIYQTSGTLTLQDSIFSENYARGGVGSGPAAGFGGAISALAGTVSISGGAFITNASVGGGNFGFNGLSEAQGGAVYLESGVLNISNAKFTGNTADGLQNSPSFGGAVAAMSGDVAIDYALFLGNFSRGGQGFAPNSGGGNSGGDGRGGAVNIGTNVSATISRSAFLENTVIGGNHSYNRFSADGHAYGGAVAVQGQAALVNCTFVANLARTPRLADFSPVLPPPGEGAAIYNTGTIGATNVTISANISEGPILISSAGSFTLKNSLFAKNDGPTGGAGLTDAGHNLSATASPALTQSSSRNNLNLKLGPLGDYGGPTPTIVLMAGSPAIDSADDAAAPATDQRGHARPFSAHADVGAFESSPPFHIWGTLHGYRNESTTVTFGGTTIQPSATGAFEFNVPAGPNSFSFTGTNTVFRANPLVIDVTADMQFHTRAFQLGALAFDPDLPSPAFTLAGRAGEAWEIFVSTNLVDWVSAGIKTFTADGIVSVAIPNPNVPTFAKAGRK